MTKLLEPHPFAEVFPTLDGEAFDALVKDIDARDQQEPIWVYEGKILDGRNRYRACQILGRDPVSESSSAMMRGLRAVCEPPSTPSQRGPTCNGWC